MTTLTQTNSPAAVAVEISEDALRVSFSDGRVVAVPLSWYPRLSQALPEHRKVWEFIGGGHGIHWSEIDEDVSVENILYGQPSGESAKSFARWKEWYQKKTNKKKKKSKGGKKAKELQPV